MECFNSLVRQKQHTVHMLCSIYIMLKYNKTQAQQAKTYFCKLLLASEQHIYFERNENQVVNTVFEKVTITPQLNKTKFL